MNSKFISLSSMAMDLKRAALGSEKSAKIFLNEALKRKEEIGDDVPAYIKKILKNIEHAKDKEDLLMYSILLQNYSLKYGRK